MIKSKKIDYAAARKNMVDCQLMTNGISSPEIINSFSSVPREVFVPESCLGAAYLDEDIRMSNDTFLIEPVIHARMLQHIKPDMEESALVVGDYTGYGAAVLANLVSTVVTLEESIGGLDNARAHWDGLEFCNIAIVQGKASMGEPAHAPYNLIFMQGAVAQEPRTLLDQLDVEGRLVCVFRPDVRSVGRICVFKKLKDGDVSRQCFEDAATPYLAGYEPEKRFVF